MCGCWVSPPAATTRGRSVSRRDGRRGCEADRGDPHRARGLTRHLRGAAHSRRTGRQWYAGWPQARCTPMWQAGLAGVSRRKFVTTTLRGDGRQAPDLVERNFTAGTESACGSWISPTSRPRRVSLSRRGARRLQPPHRRLVDGHDTRHPTGTRRSQHGAARAAAAVDRSLGLCAHPHRVSHVFPPEAVAKPHLSADRGKPSRW